LSELLCVRFLTKATGTAKLKLRFFAVHVMVGSAEII
jgi:hypothetical protein